MATHALQHARRGTTLIEVLVVVVIMSVLAITAAPAITTTQDVTRAAAVRELRRLAEYARAHATSSGSPTGIIVDPSTDQVSLRAFVDGSVIEIVDALGGTIETVDLAEKFGGADLVSITGPLAGSESLWFDFDGTPHRRSPSGQHMGVLDAELVFTFADGGTVSVQPVGGMIR